MKKAVLLLLFGLGLASIPLLQSYMLPEPEDIVTSFEQDPPVALGYWVQQLSELLMTTI